MDVLLYNVRLDNIKVTVDQAMSFSAPIMVNVVLNNVMVSSPNLCQAAQSVLCDLISDVSHSITRVISPHSAWLTGGMELVCPR